MADALTVDVVAPDRILWSGTAERVIAPSVEGEIGLLAGHEPVLSILGTGTVRVHGSGGEQHSFHIDRGLVSFDHDVITLVVRPIEAE